MSNKIGNTNNYFNHIYKVIRIPKNQIINKIVILFFAISMFLPISLFVGCSEQKAISVDKNDNGRLIELNEGQKLVITLESNPTTGYSWNIAELDESMLKQEGDIEFISESNLIGSPGVEIIKFNAVKSGQTTLKLIYHRSWEEDVKPIETFSIQVKVLSANF